MKYRNLKKQLLSLLTAACLLFGSGSALTSSAAAANSNPAPTDNTLPFGSTISAGAAHMVVIKKDGTLWAWGRNVDNRLGTGKLAEKVTRPVKVPLDKKVVSVSAGGDTTAVITADGELWNWGSDNWHGNLGRETEGDNIGPGKVMDGVRSISAHGYHSATITQDGTLWVWGRNSHGELGNNRQGTIVQGKFRSFSYEFLPTKLMENVVSVETSITRTFAILEDGSLWGWGENENGELGNDTSVWNKGEHDDSLLGITERWTETYDEDYTLKTATTSALLKYNAGETRECSCTYQPVPVKIMDNVAKVFAGMHGTIILKTDGSVWTCGGARELADGRYTYAPEKVLDGAMDVTTNGETFAAVKKDGSLWTWGGNAFGMLGKETNSVTEEQTPTKIMSNVAAVTAAPLYMAALKKDGTLWMWGDNSNGQLGVKTERYYTSTPTKVMSGVALPGKDTARSSSAEGTLSPSISAENTAAQSTAIPFQRAVRKNSSSEKETADAGFDVPGAGGMQIPSTAIYINGNAYSGYLINNYTWEEAKAYCESVGGHLATLSTRDEQTYLRYPQGLMFIGGRRNASGQWYWLTGESVGIGAEGNAALDRMCLRPDGQWSAVGSDFRAAGFVCEWELGRPQATSYTVYFNAGGGMVSAASKQVVNGQTYGTLPVPTKQGCSFLGWYTNSSGSGTPITAGTTVSLTGNQTLYAIWATAQSGPSVSAISYGFANSQRDFGYQNGFKIPFEPFAEIYGNSQKVWNLYQQEVKPWNGSCFGMSSSAAWLYMNHYSVPRSQMTLDGSQMNIGNKTYTLRQLIDMMQILQYSDFYHKARSKNDYNYSALVSAVMNFENTNSQPVFLSIWSPPDSNGRRAGHAVLGLAARRDTANKKDTIQIYDPNYPLDSNRWLDIYWSTPGNYTGWYYPISSNESWGSAYGNGKLTFTVYSDVMSVWNNRGSEAALTSDKLSVNCANASVYDYTGNLAAVIRDGKVISNRTDIFAFGEPTDAAANAAGLGEGVSLWVPHEYFTIVNEDKNVKELSVALSGQDSSLAVSTSSDRVMFYNDEAADASVAVVNGKNKDYEMVLSSGDSEEIRLTGTTKEDTPTCFAQISGKLSGMSVKENAELKIKGKSESMDRVAQTTAVSIVTSTAPSAISSVFLDVPRDASYAPAVQWAYDNGIAAKTDGKYFAPERACTRAEALTFLWQALGRPTAASSAQPFADVRESDDLYQAAAWAASTGVVPGTDETHFSPDQTCTNEEFLTFLWCALGKPEERIDFAGYDSAAAWAEGRGLLQNLNANSLCRRRDAVEFLYQTLA